MKDIGKELKELGDAIATSLGCAVLAVSVVITIAIVMRAIYYQPSEEDYERPSHGGSRGLPIAVQLSTNPTYRWHPSNVYHRQHMSRSLCDYHNLKTLYHQKIPRFWALNNFKEVYVRKLV